jgi:hypothetical protein
MPNEAVVAASVRLDLAAVAAEVVAAYSNARLDVR